MSNQKPTNTWMLTQDKGGSAILILPKDLTAHDLNDLGEWFALILRSLLRQHEALAPAPPQDGETPT